MKSGSKIVALSAAISLVAASIAVAAAGHERRGHGRIVILVVCDGLRPDFVTHENMPALFAMAREGVRFDRHHSLYPTLTMVNAAGFATGAQPGVSGVLGNVMYLKPIVGSKVPFNSSLSRSIAQPQFLENTKLWAQLNAPAVLDGHLLALDTVPQEAEREGGYIAVMGKAAPAFLFDNRVADLNGGHDILNEPHADFLFATDDLAAPEPETKSIADTVNATAFKARSSSARDEFYTTIAIDKAIPAARAASDQGRPALIVLWLRDPDQTQHHAGLGTLQDLEALSACDADIARIRKAIAQAGIGARTDLMVASDHGFATIRMGINLNGLLVGAGIKKSMDSTEIVIARNGGSDLIYLSPEEFGSVEARRKILQKIVEFAEAQEWCGPIFSRESAPPGDSRRHERSDFAGWIDGTFSQATVGIYNPTRSPDLVISFREFPDQDNSALTGPSHPAFMLDAHGQHSGPNASKELVHPVPGVNYADASGYTTGMGMHGAAGSRELHNFCAAIGPDFRKQLVDHSPTSNADIAPTITQILKLEPNVGPGGVYETGRVMGEALREGKGAPGAGQPVRMTTAIELQGARVVTTLDATQLGKRLYLDDSSVEHIPLGHSP